jgi:hypothetical protein
VQLRGHLRDDGGPPGTRRGGARPPSELSPGSAHPAPHVATNPRSRARALTRTPVPLQSGTRHRRRADGSRAASVDPRSRDAVGRQWGEEESSGGFRTAPLRSARPRLAPSGPVPLRAAPVSTRA